MPGFRRRRTFVRPRSTFRKKRSFGTRKRRHVRRSTGTVVNRQPRGSHIPIPLRFLTRGVITFVGYVPSGVASGYFYLNATSIYQPGNQVSAKFTDATNGSGVVAVGGLTNNVVGYTDLSAIYDNYKVHSSRVKVTCNPQNQADSSTFAMCPVNGNLLSNVNVSTVIDSAYGKYKQVNSSSDARANTISMKCRINKLLGITKRQYLDVANPAINGVLGSQFAAYWLIAWAVSDATNLGARLDFVVEMEYWYELTNIASPIN